jgi:dihydrofolate reductase
MKVTLAMSISPNGLVARENGEEDWLPSEGWDEFLADAKAFNNIVMGRETYEVVQKLYKDYNFDNVETGYKVIVTRNGKFKADSSYIVVLSPEEAIKFLEDKAVENILLIGGGKLNSQFIKQNLVDEIWLTINPYILGKGRPFIFPEEFDIPMNLIDHRALSKGRIKIKYKVTKYVN